jgi:iron uptake system EfeUOB component EfeO/EfeM
MLIGRAAAAAATVALAVGGCGSDGSTHADQGRAQPLSERNPVSAAMPPATPAEFTRPIRAYRRHVIRQLTAMAADVAGLRAAIAAGDLRGARAAWRTANARYDAVAANVRGTRVVLGTLAPMIDARSRGARLSAQRGLDRLERALRALRRRHGAYPTLRATGRREREQIAALVAAAAEQLAVIPELIDPRPPRPVRGAFGEVAR